MMKSSLPPPLTYTQEWFVKHMMRKQVVYFKKSKRTGQWVYYRVWLGRKEEPLYITNTNTVKALIRKNAIVPTMSDKEFKIQYALGVIDYREYRLPLGYE